MAHYLSFNTPMNTNNLLSKAFSIADAIVCQANEIGIGLDRRALSEAGSDIQELKWTVAQNNLSLVKERVDDLKSFNLPCICKCGSGKWLVVVSVTEDMVSVCDGQLDGQYIDVPIAVFSTLCSSDCLLLRKTTRYLEKHLAKIDKKRHWFWFQFLDRKKSLFDIFGASFTANLLAAVASLFSLQVYDRVIPNRSEDTLFILMVGVFIAIAFEATLRVARSSVIDREGREIDEKASLELLHCFIGLKISATSPKASHIVQLMRDFGNVREFFTEAAVGAIVDVPFTFLFLILIYVISGMVVLVPIVGIILMLVPSFVFRHKMQRVARSSLGAHTAAGRIVNEMAYGLETVKVTIGGSFFMRQWKEASQLISDAALKQRSLSTKMTQWSASVMQAVQVLTVAACVFAVFKNEQTIGGIIATTILVSRAMSPMSRMSTVLMRWHQLSNTIQSLNLVTQSPSDHNVQSDLSKRGASPATFHLDGLKYRYMPSDAPVLDIPNLKISRGEKVAILGANGSGKSTLLKIFSNLYSAETGRFLVDGMDIDQIDVGDYRRAVSYLPQESVFFRGTLRENLTMGRRSVDDLKILSALTAVGLESFIRKHKSGLNMMMEDGGAGLSVGQRQSVGLARILLLDAGSLLLDEPTASLDTITEEVVIKNLGDFSKKRTLIVATHRLPILALVDRIIVLNRGSIVLDGDKDFVIDKIKNANK